MRAADSQTAPRAVRFDRGRLSIADIVALAEGSARG